MYIFLDSSTNTGCLDSNNNHLFGHNYNFKYSYLIQIIYID